MSDWGSTEQPGGGTPQYDAAQPSAGGAMAAGWYPDQTGQMRWWDGAQWGPYAEAGGAAAPAQPQMAGAGMGQQMPGVPNARSQAALAHWLGLLGFIGPLIIYVTSGNQDPFVRHNAAESLNFQLTMLIGYFISGILMFVCIGFVTVFIVWGMSIVYAIIGAQAANRGEWYKYPINIRMVSGAAV